MRKFRELEAGMPAEAIAEVDIRGIAPTLEQAFEQAAVAMTAVITYPEQVSASKAVCASQPARVNRNTIIRATAIWSSTTRIFILSVIVVPEDHCQN